MATIRKHQKEIEKIRKLIKELKRKMKYGNERNQGREDLRKVD